MKKFVVLMLVLGMVSMASATLTIVESAVDVVDGGSTTITLASDTTSGWGMYIKAPSGSTGITAITEISNNAGDDGYANIHTNNTYAASGYWDIAASDASDPFTSIVPGNQFTVTIDDGGLASGGTYLIELRTYGWTAGGDSIVVSVIPEPATMCLLGLGGLLLRRKKK